MCELNEALKIDDELKFEELFKLNVNDKTEIKQSGNTKLTYLSWSFAWSEFVKVYPKATYEIIKNEKGLPYFADESGAMVYTKVTAGKITHEMWLPVMDGANKAMKSQAYEYKTKYDTKRCEAYTMFDINKTVMRCLVKNLAMFGLGLYIYAGEDLPEQNDKAEVVQEPTQFKPCTQTQVKIITDLIETKNVEIEKFYKAYSILSVDELSFDDAGKAIVQLNKKK